MRVKLTQWLFFLAVTCTYSCAFAVDTSLSKSINLLATCTVEDDGYIGFKLATTEVEKIFAKGRYERTIVSCFSYIQGVTDATVHSGKESLCISSTSMEDIKSAVVITLKQGYQNEQHSVPLILKALKRNWLCE